MPISHRGPCFLALLALFAASGCSENEPIRRYQVAKQVAVDASNRGSDKTNPRIVDPKPDEAKSRMLGATVISGEDVWFFKLVGDIKKIDALSKDFDAFVRSAKFEADPPAWQLPNDWKEERHTSPGSIRYSTVTIGEGDDKQELTITRLPMPLGADVDGVLLNNTNRWRGQMRLARIKRNRLFRPQEGTPADGVLRTEWLGTHRLYLADLHGTFVPRPMGPMPGFNPPGAGPSRPPASNDFTFKKPDDWKQGRMSSIRKAAFEVHNAAGDREAEITVIPALGSYLANVVRWRGQIGLGDMTQEEMEKAFVDVPVGKMTGKFIEIVGSGQTILAVILERGEQKWFFKLTGTNAAAKVEKERFLGFVKSFEFK